MVDAMTALYKQRENGDLCITEIKQAMCHDAWKKDGLCPHFHSVYIHKQLLKNGAHPLWLNFLMASTTISLEMPRSSVHM